jgi:hypothetical protein
LQFVFLHQSFVLSDGVVQFALQLFDFLFVIFGQTYYFIADFAARLIDLIEFVAKVLLTVLRRKELLF